MLLSPAQIRAARALLDWNQEDLANATGLARPTIVNIESKHQMPGSKTIEKLLAVFDKAGVRFTENDGVRKKKSFVRVFRGEKEAYEYFNIVLNHTKKTFDPIFINNVSPDSYARCFTDFYNSPYVQEMSKMKDKIDTRIISCEGDNREPIAYATYRRIPKKNFSAATPFYVFGDYLAICLFLDEVMIFLIKDKSCAELYRKKFLSQWDLAIPGNNN